MAQKHKNPYLSVDTIETKDQAKALLLTHSPNLIFCNSKTDKQELSHFLQNAAFPPPIIYIVGTKPNSKELFYPLKIVHWNTAPLTNLYRKTLASFCPQLSSATLFFRRSQILQWRLKYKYNIPTTGCVLDYIFSTTCRNKFLWNLLDDCKNCDNCDYKYKLQPKPQAWWYEIFAEIWKNKLGKKNFTEN